MLLAKYGQEGFGWMTKKANGTFGVGVWKEILKEKDWCWENMAFTMGNGTKIRFWTNLWCGCTVLSQRFPHLYGMVAHRNGTVEEMWDQNVGQGGWDLRFVRGFNDWELDMVGEDAVFWKGGRNGQFKVKEAYNLVVNTVANNFLKSNIWVDKVPTKILFFAWEATWGKVLTLDRLQKRGWQLPNRCFLCGCEEETVNHILIHCIVVKVLWDMICALFGVQWVFPETVKEVLLSWRGPFVGEKRKKIWKSIPLYIF